MEASPAVLDLPQNSSIQACKTRTILQPEQAIEILLLKQSSKMSNAGKALPREIAKRYGISEKAVRDIWKGRTWLRETMHLDPALTALASRLRPPGRPRAQPESVYITASGNTFERLQEAASLTMPQCVQPKQAGMCEHDASPARPIFGRCSPPSCSELFCGERKEYGFQIAQMQWRIAAPEAPLPPPSSRADDPFHDDWAY